MRKTREKKPMTHVRGDNQVRNTGQTGGGEKRGEARTRGRNRKVVERGTAYWIEGGELIVPKTSLGNGARHAPNVGDGGHLILFKRRLSQ